MRSYFARRWWSPAAGAGDVVVGEQEGEQLQEVRLAAGASLRVPVMVNGCDRPIVNGAVR